MNIFFMCTRYQKHDERIKNDNENVKTIMIENQNIYSQILFVN